MGQFSYGLTAPIFIPLVQGSQSNKHLTRRKKIGFIRVKALVQGFDAYSLFICVMYTNTVDNFAETGRLRLNPIVGNGNRFGLTKCRKKKSTLISAMLINFNLLTDQGVT